MHRHRINVHFKGQKSSGTTVFIKSDDGETMEEVMAEEIDADVDVDADGAEEAQFVTITTKGDDDDDVDGDGDGADQQTMHRLVFISENEAILV